MVPIPWNESWRCLETKNTIILPKNSIINNWYLAAAIINLNRVLNYWNFVKLILIRSHFFWARGIMTAAICSCHNPYRCIYINPRIPGGLEEKEAEPLCNLLLVLLYLQKRAHQQLHQPQNNKINIIIDRSSLVFNNIIKSRWRVSADNAQN